MTRIIIKEFVWDSINLEHIKKHSISGDEVEQAKNFICHWRTHTGRYLIVSRVGSRMISVVLRRVSNGRYYVVTARDAGKKDRRRAYEKENEK